MTRDNCPVCGTQNDSTVWAYDKDGDLTKTNVCDRCFSEFENPPNHVSGNACPVCNNEPLTSNPEGLTKSDTPRKSVKICRSCRRKLVFPNHTEKLTTWV